MPSHRQHPLWEVVDTLIPGEGPPTSADTAPAGSSTYKPDTIQDIPRIPIPESTPPSVLESTPPESSQLDQSSLESASHGIPPRHTNVVNRISTDQLCRLVIMVSMYHLLFRRGGVYCYSLIVVIIPHT